MSIYKVTFQPNNRSIELYGSVTLRQVVPGNFFPNRPDGAARYSGLNPPIFRTKLEAEEGSEIIPPSTTISQVISDYDITKDLTDPNNITLTIYTSEAERGSKKRKNKKLSKKKGSKKKGSKKKKKHKKKRKLSTRAAKSTRTSLRSR